MSYYADWEKVVSFVQAGTLWKSMDTDESWYKCLDCLPEPLDTYTMVAEAYEQLCKALPEDIRQKTDEFFDQLISQKGGCCQDLGCAGEDLEICALSLSPESVARLKAVGDLINFEQLHDAFYSECREDTKADLGCCAEVQPEQSFEEVFLPYVQMWCEALKLAADEGKGILVKWG
jgi:hypothetical protein